MQFEEIHKEITGLYTVVLIFSIPAGAFLADKLSKSTLRPWVKYGFLSIGPALLIAALCVAGLIHTDSSNKQAFENNLKQKYGIEKVYLSFDGKSVSPTATEVQSVFVKIDGAIHEFYVSQDQNTWEPTLTPVDSGEEIKLRDKSETHKG